MHSRSLDPPFIASPESMRIRSLQIEKIHQIINLSLNGFQFLNLTFRYGPVRRLVDEGLQQNVDL